MDESVPRPSTPEQVPVHPWIVKEAHGDAQLLGLLNEREAFGNVIAKHGGSHQIPDEARDYQESLKEAISKRQRELGIDPITKP